MNKHTTALGLFLWGLTAYAVGKLRRDGKHHEPNQEFIEIELQ